MAVNDKGRQKLQGQLGLSKQLSKRNVSDIQRFVAILLLILALSVLSSFVSSLNFTNTGLPGFVGINPASPKVPVHPVPANPTNLNMNNLSNISNPPNVPIYFVEGLNQYTYLMRLYTSAYYNPITHAWIKEKESYAPMHSASYTVKYKVTPIVAFRGNIPVAQKTFFVSLKNAKYSPETSTFYVNYDKKPYIAFSSANKYSINNQGSLSETGFETTSGANSKYLEVNCYGKKEIKDLALKVTKGAKTEYEKAKKIANFLKRNYTYGFVSYNNHPIYDFLFVKKTGICKNFASAFVMMCRSIGLPARMVFGYMARPVPYNQTVFLSQAHAWAEVKIGNEWVEFNPTPSPMKIPTETKITYINKEIYAGENLTLNGIVKITNSKYTYMQKYLTGYVEIYIAKNKNDKNTYQLLTIVPVKYGHFSASVKVNKTGEYNVLAHYTGSLLFYSSWSDPVVKILGRPYIVVNIGNKVATTCYINGSVKYTKPVNGTIYLYVDNFEYFKNFNGTFHFKVKLSKGIHTIKLYYPGSKTYFIAPAVLTKKVEAEYVKLQISNLTAIAGKLWKTKITLLFNGKPTKARVILGNPFNKKIFVYNSANISAKAPEKSGVYSVLVKIPSMGYMNRIEVYVKSETYIDAGFSSNTLIIRVLDNSGKYVHGNIYVNNKLYHISGNVLKLKFKNVPNRVVIFYPGDKIHLPAKKVVSKPLPVWIYLLPLPLIVLVALRLRKKKTLAFYYTPPPIWLPGDEVEVKVTGEGIVRIKVDGEVFDFKRNEVVYNSKLDEGKHIIEAEVLNEKGKILETKKFEFYVLPFWRAIAKIFEEVISCGERKLNESLKDYTAREVLDKLRVDSKLKRELLSFFEPNRYGTHGIRGTRKDIEAFYLLCRKVIENVGC